MMPVSLSATIGNYLKMLVYTMVYSGPPWFVGLPATEHCCYTNYTGESHRVNPTFLELKKKGNGQLLYLANLVGFLGRWPTIIFHPWPLASNISKFHTQLTNVFMLLPGINQCRPLQLSLVQKTLSLVINYMHL